MTDLDEHFAVNAALVQQRVELGDLAEYPRSVDHTAYFPRKGLDVGLAALRSAGFVVDDARKGFRRVEVRFSRQDAVDLATANAFTQQVVDLVEGHGGTYDGWGGFLVTEPPAG